MVADLREVLASAAAKGIEADTAPGPAWEAGGHVSSAECSVKRIRSVSARKKPYFKRVCGREFFNNLQGPT